MQTFIWGIGALLLAGCGGGISTPGERSTAPQMVSSATAQIVAEIRAGKLPLRGRPRIAVLYHQDRPAHRQRVLDWFEKNTATVLYEDTAYGYIDAELDWAALEKLIETRGDLGLSESSMLKLELDMVTASPADTQSRMLEPPPALDKNTSFSGPVHSAGYGAGVRAFREQAARDLGTSVDAMAGQGIKVAVFDDGIDLSRTDVFGERLRDYVVGEDRVWIKALQNEAEFLKAQSLTELPQSLRDLKSNKTLRFAYLDEKTAGYDLNGSSKDDDKLAVAVYENQKGEWEARVRVDAKQPFGIPIIDFGKTAQKGQARIVDFYTGREYVRATQRPTPSAGAFKFRADKAQVPEIALVGIAAGASGHGIANLHMVGGDYALSGSGERFQGVAPGVDFLGVQTWQVSGEGYGNSWIPLARTILESVKKGADILDLDIFTPGPREGDGLLSTLLCRITARTSVVPVVAAHNYSPLPDTVQSLAQSPCVLGIGAAHSKARLALGDGPEAPGASDLAGAEDVQTTFYSGRGFGLNGALKPDVISPAYGYTAYNGRMIRFGGTSGATPTTAGILALLKQAARARGVELGLDQMRVLLQASSRDPGAARLREGYGFTQLASAWELFKKTHAPNQPGLAPLRLLGHKRLFFQGRPGQRRVSVELNRAEVLGGSRSAIPLKFSIRYGGGSVNLGVEWIKFFNPENSKLVSSMELDSPLEGETQTLRLDFLFEDGVWERLPPGDHIALIEASRLTLADSRPADFLLPVVVTKPLEVEPTLVVPIAPLYTDQNLSLAVETNPGDVLYISGNIQCSTGSPHGLTGKPDTLFITVDTEPFYQHVFHKVSSYTPAELSPVPFRIEARKRMVRLAAYRRNSNNCEGPLTGSIRIDRHAAKSTWQQMAWSSKDGKQHTVVDQRFRVPFEAPVSGENLNIHVTGLHWVFRRVNTGANTITAAEGNLETRVVPAQDQTFQGILAEFTPDGNFVREARSDATFASGIGSLDEPLYGEPTGLVLGPAQPGNLLAFAPASAKQLSAWSVTLQGAELGLQSTVASKAPRTEITESEMHLRAIHQLNVPQTLPAAFKEFEGWDKYIELEVAASFQKNGFKGIEFPERTIWKEKIRVPVP